MLRRYAIVAGLLMGFVFVASPVSAEDDAEKTEPKTDRMAELFKKLDKNGDGKLTMEEFSAIATMRQDMGKGGTGGGFGKGGKGGIGGGKIDPEKLKEMKEKFEKMDPEKLKELKEKFSKGKFGNKKIDE